MYLTLHVYDVRPRLVELEVLLIHLFPRLLGLFVVSGIGILELEG
jgi:hypothetical protein